MAPRWKWALGFLSSCNVFLSEQAELLDRYCFGRLVFGAEKDKRWIQLSYEEAFFLFYKLKCIKISLHGRSLGYNLELISWCIDITHLFSTLKTPFLFSPLAGMIENYTVEEQTVRRWRN
ncbi:unnamed protein product [Arabidopsis thaliana]|uniref:tRNA intron endonuclease N-terminal domain-containing protein n=1 Tax=Arabidopsis thaliana TaxID=3702 RepID=A0A654FD16_ARATH|nr:unnamed protein product [Arabidopsis thaliana]